MSLSDVGDVVRERFSLAGVPDRPGDGTEWERPGDTWLTKFSRFIEADSRICTNLLHHDLVSPVFTVHHVNHLTYTNYKFLNFRMYYANFLNTRVPHRFVIKIQRRFPRLSKTSSSFSRTTFLYFVGLQDT